MNLDARSECTRRHFFGRPPPGIGTRGAGLAAPSAQAFARRGLTGPAAFPADSEAGHLSAPVRRPVATGSVRLQAAVAEAARDRSAGLGPDGTAHYRHDFRPEHAAGRAVDLQVQAARQIRRLGQRTAAAHGEDRGRPLHHQNGQHGRHQSRPGHHVYPNRLAATGPTEHGLVGQLWDRQRERQPAGVCGAAFAGARDQHRSAAVLATLVERLSPVRATRASASASGAIPCCIFEMLRASRARHAAECSTAVGELNRKHVAEYGDPEIQTPHSPVRDGVPDADVGAGSDGFFERARQHVRAVRPGSRRSRGTLRGELPAGAPTGRAQRALHPALSSRLGSAQRSAARPGASVQRNGPTDRRADAGPEAARSAGRHAGDLGRRVRPHRVLPGQADGGELRTRSPSAAASRCGWPAAESSPAR